MCLPNLKLSSSLRANDATIVDFLSSLRWKDEKLRLVSQARLRLRVCFASDFIFPYAKKINRLFRQGEVGESTFNE